jgi:hypothetical protein
VTYPDFPGDQLVFNADVTATSASQWSTQLTVNGTYNGPTHIAAVRDYHITWTRDGTTIFEQGSATLLVQPGSIGAPVATQWTSTITPKNNDLSRFPAEGESINVTYTPFRISGNSMSYDWTGTVSVQSQ